MDDRTCTATLSDGRGPGPDDPRPTGPGRRMTSPSALLAIVLGVLALGSGSAAAAAAVEPATVARALERSPVYIDPALDGTISPTAADRIAASIERADRDVHVVLVRLERGDRFDGSGRSFLAAVRSRLERDGVFVVAESGDYLTAEEYRNGLQRRGGTLQDVTTLANFADRGESTVRRTLLQRVERFVALLGESPARIAARTAAYEREQQEQADESRRSRGSSGSPFGPAADGGDGLGTGTIVGLVLGFVVVLGGAAAAARRRRRGARVADGPLPVVPDRVFEHARAARRAELREDADAELLALATLLDEQPVPDAERAQDAYQRALDAYAAARRCASEDAPTVDLVGILVLVDRARGDLAAAAAIDAGRRPGAWVPLCAVHPLHGRSAKVVSWRRGLDVPACGACATAIRRGRDPEALRDGDVPYFEGDTVWARTGYGAWAPDLVERVSRGER